MLRGLRTVCHCPICSGFQRAEQQVRDAACRRHLLSSQGLNYNLICLYHRPSPPRYIHLTNSSVQKSRTADASKLPPFLRPPSSPASQQSPRKQGGAAPPLQGGSKCALETLIGLLSDQGVAWGPLWGRIQEVIIVALVAAQDAIPHCTNR